MKIFELVFRVQVHKFVPQRNLSIIFKFETSKRCKILSIFKTIQLAPIKSNHQDKQVLNNLWTLGYTICIYFQYLGKYNLKSQYQIIFFF